MPPHIVLSDTEEDSPTQQATTVTSEKSRPSQKRKHTALLDDDNGPADGVNIPVRKTKKRDNTEHQDSAMKALGGHIGRYILFTVNFSNVLLRTHDNAVEEYEEPLPQYEADAMENAYHLIEKHFARQLRTIPADGPGVLAIRLGDGLREAHHHNVKTLKKHIAEIYDLDELPKDKGSWGFRHSQIAELLRPIDIELNSAEWDDLLAGNTFPSPNVWPAFTYRDQNGPKSMDDVVDGFLMDDALIKVARSILFPPDYISKYVAANTGYAANWAIKKVSCAFIAYVVELTQFCLSSEMRHGSGSFEYQTFYNNLVAHLTHEKLQAQTKDILQWWNTQLFSTFAKQKGKSKLPVQTNKLVSTSMFLAQVSKSTTASSTEDGASNTQGSSNKENVANKERSSSLNTLASVATRERQTRTRNVL